MKKPFLFLKKDMFHLLGKSFPRPQAPATLVNLISAALLVCCANTPFWREFFRRINPENAGHWIFLGVVFLCLLLLFTILISLFSIRIIHKPLLILIFFVAAVVNYYMDSYGIVIDRQMITNLLETDVREASEQLTWPFFRHLVLMWILPSLLLILTTIRYRPWRSELLVRSGVILGSSAVLAALIMANYSTFVLFGRKNIELRMYINPTYPIYSLIKTVNKHRQAGKKEPLRVIAADATRPADSSRSAVVLVVGETARAEQFSLNGYQRETNPQLRARNVINFSNVQSCGTDTAESLPCMFFHLGKNRYSRNEASRHENLLDVLKRTGVEVIWRDNNSGSKGISDRVTFESLTADKDPALCSSGECYDEILLKGLGDLLDRNTGDMFIVLHQKGSHGPSYYKRSPKAFEKFLPECTQDNVQDCDRESIINAYDNTIVYTDHVLSRLIDLLQARKYATAMLYVSDHGESLGENNIYLHGLPYSLAPTQQTHVPMIFWASRTFLSENRINTALLVKEQHNLYTHDNLFHSILGLYHIKTGLYRAELDLFNAARGQ